MTLNMNREVFITCAVTGSGNTQNRSKLVPRSPKEIANSAIEAAKAGAAIVHCHVREPDTGLPSRNISAIRTGTETCESGLAPQATGRTARRATAPRPSVGWLSRTFN